MVTGNPLNRELLLSRQAAIVTDPSLKSILFIGTGGIGSNAVHIAASTGFEDITIVDFDVVKAENTYPGLFRLRRDVGKSKVQALAEQIQDACGILINTFECTIAAAKEKLDNSPFDIVVLSTDSSDSRWQGFDAFSHMATWWIDAAMGGTSTTVTCFKPSEHNQEEQKYLELFDIPEADLLCGMKATAPLTKGFIPGMIGQCLVDIANNRKPPYIQRYDLVDRQPVIIY